MALNTQPHLAPRLKKERSEEHTSELQSHSDIVCRLLLEKKNGEDCELSQRAQRYGTLQIVDGSDLFHHASTVNCVDFSMFLRRFVNYLYFFFNIHAAHKPLHSFPTRRSSD